MIVVSFDDGHQTDQRLAAAAVVYGLSPGQLRLAKLVVDGHDLADAARELGISVNTARTHLQRIFDKTGVRSQPALVRVLLSAGAPVGMGIQGHRRMNRIEIPAAASLHECEVQDVGKMRSPAGGRICARRSAREVYLE